MASKGNGGTYQPSIGIGAIYPRGKRGTHYFEFQGLGQRIKQSLGTTNPEEAEKEARKRFGYLLAGDRVEQLQEAKARLAVAQDEEQNARRTVISLDVEGIWKHYQRQLSLVSVSRRHADGTRTTPLSPRTLRQTKSSLTKFLAWYHDGNGTGKAMHNVSRSEAQDYFADLLAAGAKLSSYNRYLADLRVIWKRLADKIASANPFDSVPQRKKGEVDEDTQHKEPFTPQELATIHEKATGWIAVAVVVGQETGLRLGDVVTLQVSEIDGDHLVRETRKSKKEQVLYAPASCAAIREWIGTDGREFVFPEMAKRYMGLAGFKRNGTAPVKEFMTFLRETCEMETRQGGQTVKGFHSLRVTAATQTALHGGNAQDLLGHTDKRVTDGYVQPTLEEAKAMATRASQSPLEQIKAGILTLDEGERKDLGKWLQTL
jgi:integrase